MGWSKQELIEQAFDELAKSVGTFNIDPDVMMAALRKLDGMMATWNGRGIHLGYPLPSSPNDSNLDDQSGLPDYANEAVYLNLALRIAPSIGKTVSPETRIGAKEAFNVVLAKAAFPQEQQLPNTLPRGAGNKPVRTGSPFMPQPEDLLTAGGDPLEFN